MCKVLPVVLFVCVVNLFAAPVLAEDFHVDKYSLRLQYLGDSTIHMQAAMRAQVIKSTNQFLFLLDSDAAIEVVTVKLGKQILLSRLEQNGDTVRVILKTHFSKGALIHITLQYKLFLPAPMETAYPLWNWYPKVPNTISAFSVQVSTIPEMLFVTNGIKKNHHLTNRYENYQYALPYKISKLVLVIIPKKYFVRQSLTTGAVTISSYVQQKDSITAIKFMNSLTNVWLFYNEFIDTNVLSTCTVISIPEMQSVISLPSIILIGEPFLSMFSNSQFDCFPHEAAHQWFGSGVFPETSDPRMWALFEPIAEYLKILYISGTGGEAAVQDEICAKKREYNLEIVNTQFDLSLWQSGSNRATYIVGPIVFDSVRSTMGAKKFQNFLRRLYSEFKGQILSYQTFLDKLAITDPKACTLFLELVVRKGKLYY